MTQEATQITTTPPLPGLQLVQDLNKALQTLGTDFAGSSDPAALAWPYATWADTGTGTVKRRNAANSAWVIEGRLFRAHLPIIPLADIPTTDIGQISVITKGTMEWDGSAYVPLTPDVPSLDDLQWLGTPIGGYITPKVAPPTDDPRFRYVLCTAGQTGSGGYNEGILTSESVSGSSPLIVATATVDLDGSPFDGESIHLINTEGRFVGAGESEAFEDDSFQSHVMELRNLVNTTTIREAATSGSGGQSVFVDGNLSSNARFQARTFVSDGVNGTPRTGNHTQPRAHRLPHYRRIL